MSTQQVDVLFAQLPDSRPRHTPRATKPEAGGQKPEQDSQMESKPDRSLNDELNQKAVAVEAPTFKYTPGTQPIQSKAKPATQTPKHIANHRGIQIL